MSHPDELHAVFENVIANNNEGFMTVTFLDEFDVKFQDGSAIKSLINPVYDGQYWSGGKFQKFGRSIFFFAGSYLRDWETLARVQRAAGLNLSRFLLDLYLAHHRLGNTEALARIAELQRLCDVHRRWRTEADPRTDVVGYLLELDKIRDFLSRVGGNIVEILDLTWPLGVTQELFVFEGTEVRPSTRVRLTDVVTFVQSSESAENGFRDYSEAHEPLLDFKNRLVCERAMRVGQALAARFKGGGLAGIDVDRRLFNFLTLVPLVNGMRSLEQLVNSIEARTDGRLSFRDLRKEDTLMVIQENPRFRDPLQVWDEVCRANRRLSQLFNEVASEIQIAF
jgi:hypothetical protein